MSGFSSDLVDVKDLDMFKQVSDHLQKDGDARILSIFIICYSVPDKEYNQLLYLVTTHKETV